MVYDVIVSGLGPAGMAFLKSISGTGLKILALERETFPKKKPCAGGITEKAYKLLDFLFPGIESTFRVSSNRIEFYYKRKMVELKTPFAKTYFTKREDFDYFLFDSLPHEEFEIHTGEATLDVEKLRDQLVIVKTNKATYKCKVLIVSEGVNSKTAAKFKLKRDIGFTYETEIDRDIEERVIIDFSRVSWGYYWAFPKGGFTTTGVGEFRSKKVIKDIKKVLLYLNSKHGFGLSKITWERGFPIPAGKRKNDVYRDRILFLGDSGGLVDPLTGEGIYYAIRSGIIAADVVESAFTEGDFSKLPNYKKKIDKELGEEFFWARIVGSFFFPFKRMNVFLLGRSPKLGLLAANLLTGEITYKEAFFKYLKYLPLAPFGV